MTTKMIVKRQSWVTPPGSVLGHDGLFVNDEAYQLTCLRYERHLLYQSQGQEELVMAEDRASVELIKV